MAAALGAVLLEIARCLRDARQLESSIRALRTLSRDVPLATNTLWAVEALLMAERAADEAAFQLRAAEIYLQTPNAG